MLLHDFFEHILYFYKSLGAAGSFLLTFTESFLPFLPLTLIVLSNAAALGFLKGFIISTLGSIIGTIFVFYIFKYLGSKNYMKKFVKSRKITDCSQWLEKRGCLLITLFYLVPILPNFICTIVAGVHHFNIKKFIISCALGTAGQFYFLSYIGADLLTITKHPFKLCFFILFWVVLFFVNSKLSNFLNADKNRMQKSGSCKRYT